MIIENTSSASWVYHYFKHLAIGSLKITTHYYEEYLSITHFLELEILQVLEGVTKVCLNGIYKKIFLKSPKFYYLKIPCFMV